MAKLLVRNIKALVSCDPEDHVYENADLVCEDGLITQIRPSGKRPDADGSEGVKTGAETFDRVIDGTGMLC